MRMILVLMAFGLMTLPVQASSFKCEEAKTVIEKTICGDAKLSVADSTLSTAYTSALSGLSDEAQASMKASQKAWLKYVGKVCSDKAIKITMYDGISLNEARANCLTAEYESRIDILQTSRNVDGVRIYPATTYLAMPDTTEGEPFRMAHHVSAYSQIDKPDAEGLAFNRYIRKLSEKAAAARKEEGGGGDMTSDTESYLNPRQITPRRITLARDTYFYGHGAAHGMGGATYMHYLKQEQRELKVADIFKGTAWKKVVSDEAKKQLETKLKRKPDVDGGILAAVSQPTQWNLGPSGLEIQFQPYEVASYAEGMPAVIIPWSKVKQYLQPAAKDIIGI